MTVLTVPSRMPSNGLLLVTITSKCFSSLLSLCVFRGFFVNRVGVALAWMTISCTTIPLSCDDFREGGFDGSGSRAILTM